HKTETIQDLAAGTLRDHFSHPHPIDLLVEIETCLVACHQIGPETQTVDLELQFPIESAHQQSLRFRQSFEFSSARVASLQDSARGKYFLQHRNDPALSALHPSGRNLDNQHIFVFIDDETAQEVALRIHHAK